MRNINELDKDLKVLLEEEFKDKVPVTIDKIINLKGDASYRSYYRIFDDKSQTFVLMKWNPELTNKSEEATKNIKIGEFPFINISNYLRSINIAVPAILYSNVNKGIILLEDLGDITLEKRFNLTKDLRLYEKAIQLLAFLKSQALKFPDENCIAFHRKFDYDLYMWEFDHFIEYGIEARNDITLSEEDKNVLRNHFDIISRRLDVISSVFTHRDYQSRNLMIKDERIYIIDFQDALLSTPVYDIVALLRDSYIEFDEKVITELLKIYHSELKKYNIFINVNELFTLFHLQTIQRKLKDGGRFIFIDRVKKNASFLPYVSTSFRYAASAMKKFNEFNELYKTLNKYVKEFE
jgi:aminoglycoside/choline kinase family phosphotransferase